MSDGRIHGEAQCAWGAPCNCPPAGRAVQDDGLPTVEALTAALDAVWAMGWIAMPDHETKDIAKALLKALHAASPLNASGDER